MIWKKKERRKYVARFTANFMGLEDDGLPITEDEAYVNNGVVIFLDGNSSERKI